MPTVLIVRSKITGAIVQVRVFRDEWRASQVRRRIIDESHDAESSLPDLVEADLYTVEED